MLLKPMKKTILVPDGYSYGCFGRVRDVPIFFRDVKFDMHFLSNMFASLGIVIVAHLYCSLKAALDVATQFVENKHGGKTVCVGRELKSFYEP